MYRLSIRLDACKIIRSLSIYRKYRVLLSCRFSSIPPRTSLRYKPGDRRRRCSSLSGKVNEFWTRIKSAIDEGCTGGERGGERGIRPSRALNCTSSWPSSKLMKHVRTLPVPLKFSLVSPTRYTQIRLIIEFPFDESLRLLFARVK